MEEIEGRVSDEREVNRGHEYCTVQCGISGGVRIEHCSSRAGDGNCTLQHEPSDSGGPANCLLSLARLAT